MIVTRVFFMVFLFLLIFYYVLVYGHFMQLWKLVKQDLPPVKSFIPFYAFWLMMKPNCSVSKSTKRRGAKNKKK